jgi:hypothetical protein
MIGEEAPSRSLKILISINMEDMDLFQVAWIIILVASVQGAESVFAVT